MKSKRRLASLSELFTNIECVEFEKVTSNQKKKDKTKKQTDKHTKYIMDSVICRLNAGVGAVVAIIDYLLETQNNHTHLFEQLYSIQGNIGNTGNSYNECTVLRRCQRANRKSSYFATNSRKLSAVMEAA